MTEDPINSDTIDLDALTNEDEHTDVRASEGWINDIAQNLDDPNDPTAYENEDEWLIDALSALFIKTHRETEIGVLDFCGCLRAIDDSVANVANIGIEKEAREQGLDIHYSDDSLDNISGIGGELENDG